MFNKTMQLKSIWTFCVNICNPFKLWCYPWANQNRSVWILRIGKATTSVKKESGTQCGVLWLLCYQERSVGLYYCCVIVRNAVWGTMTVVFLSGTQCGVLWLLCFCQVRSVGYHDCCDVIRYAVWGTMTVTGVLLSGTQCGVLWRLCCYQVRSVGFYDCCAATRYV